MSDPKWKPDLIRTLDDEADRVDQAMAEHMRRHASSNPVNYWTCDAGCRRTVLLRELTVTAARATRVTGDMYFWRVVQPTPLEGRAWLRQLADHLEAISPFVNPVPNRRRTCTCDEPGPGCRACNPDYDTHPDITGTEAQETR